MTKLIVAFLNIANAPKNHYQAELSQKYAFVNVFYSVAINNTILYDNN